MNIAVIVAGGSGQRMGQDVPKQFLFIEEKPVIIYTLEHFQSSPLIDRIYVACLAGWEVMLDAFARQYNITKLTGIIRGGTSRCQSILHVLNAMGEDVSDDDVILTYDANRPFITDEMIEDNIAKCKRTGAAVGARASFESVYRGNGETGLLSETEERKTVYIGTGPESATYALAKEAYRKMDSSGAAPTLCEMLLSMGVQVSISASSPKCVKLTTTEDIDIFKALLKTEKYSWLK